MSAPDIAEALVEIHALVDDAVGDQMQRPDLRAVHDWIDAILDVILEGDTEDDADTLDRVAELIDSVIALDLLIPVVGPLLERFDGIAISAALHWLHGALQPDPERRARKRAARLSRRLDRRNRRQDRGGA